VRVVAEHDGTDDVFVEVHREADRSAGELEHLVRHDTRETLDTGDTVTDVAHVAHLLLLGGRLEVGYVLPQYGRDLFGVDV
jgi:hypothetical protein